MNGTQYAIWVAKYIVTNFADRGLSVYREVNMGKSIIGKNRRVDVLVINDEQNKAVALECKYQSVPGTADEKIPYTIQDSNAMQMDAFVVYGGEGFSKGIFHMLEASELACHAEPSNNVDNDYNRTSNTKELDQILAMRFKWWDIFTVGRDKIVAGEETIPAVQRIIDMLTEHFSHSTIAPMELSHHLKSLIDAGVSRKKIIQITGKNKSWLSRSLGLLELPQDVQEFAETGIVRDPARLHALSKLSEDVRENAIKDITSGKSKIDLVLFGSDKSKKKKPFVK